MNSSSTDSRGTGHPGTGWRGAPGRSKIQAALQGARRIMQAPLNLMQGRLMANGRHEGPPDLDELWRDFNRKLNGLFGKKSPGSPPPRDPSSGDGPQMPGNMRQAGIGGPLHAGVAVRVLALLHLRTMPQQDRVRILDGPDV